YTFFNILNVDNTDSNFSLQQACHKFVKTRVQACHKFVMTQECNLQQVKESFEVTMKRTCSKLATNLPCKLNANYSKNRVRTRPRNRTRDLPLGSLTG
ncbi:hypothetical protein AVEN_1688-1, partial [Araneus ventricosus]